MGSSRRTILFLVFILSINYFSAVIAQSPPPPTKDFSATSCGKEPDVSKTGCEVEPLPTEEKISPTFSCSAWPHSEPYWNEEEKTMRCRCRPGYKLAETKPLCIPMTQEELRAARYCERVPHTEPDWNEEELGCFCKEGYRLDTDQTTCIAITREQQLIDIRCETSGRPYWDEEQNKVICKYCETGFHFDGESLNCIRDGYQKPEPGADLARAIVEVASDNKVYKEMRRKAGDPVPEVEKPKPPSPQSISALEECITCVNRAIGEFCYARMAEQEKWGLSVSCSAEGFVEPQNRHIDRYRCPACQKAPWKLQFFRKYQ